MWFLKPKKETVWRKNKKWVRTLMKIPNKFYLKDHIPEIKVQIKLGWIVETLIISIDCSIMIKNIDKSEW